MFLKVLNSAPEKGMWRTSWFTRSYWKNWGKEQDTGSTVNLVSFSVGLAIWSRRRRKRSYASQDTSMWRSVKFSLREHGRHKQGGRHTLIISRHAGRDGAPVSPIHTSSARRHATPMSSLASKYRIGSVGKSLRSWVPLPWITHELNNEQKN